MVEEKVIEHLGELMKVQLKDHGKYVSQIEEILDYFQRLDKVEFSSDETLEKKVSLDELREDTSEQFLVDGKPLIDLLKKDKDNFIRAPKMI